MFRQDLAREIFPPVCASVQEAPEGHVLMKQGSKQTKTRGLGAGTEGSRGSSGDAGDPQGMTEALVAVRTAASDNSTGQEAPRSGAPRGTGALHTDQKAGSPDISERTWRRWQVTAGLGRKE